MAKPVADEAKVLISAEKAMFEPNFFIAKFQSGKFKPRFSETW